MPDDKVKNYQAHRLGTWAELTAAAFLTRRRYEVFLHLGQQSLCDLIAYQRRGIIRPRILLIDVKAVNLETKSGPKPLTAEQKAAKVVRMIVGSDGAVVCGNIITHICYSLFGFCKSVALVGVHVHADALP